MEKLNVSHFVHAYFSLFIEWFIGAPHNIGVQIKHGTVHDGYLIDTFLFEYLISLATFSA